MCRYMCKFKKIVVRPPTNIPLTDNFADTGALYTIKIAEKESNLTNILKPQDKEQSSKLLNFHI